MTYRALTAGEHGLSFTVDRFSPYALIWEREPYSGGESTVIKPEEPKEEPPEALNTEEHMAYLVGRGGGGVQPLAPITRAEFVAAAVRFFPGAETVGEADFSDVPAGAWYASAVAEGAALGLIEGRGDGSFGPEDPITRAEAAAIINRLLGRRPQGAQRPEDTIQWVDNPAGAWYYEDMLEATVSHSFVWLEEGETRTEAWTGLLEERDWAALERYGPQA